MNIFKKLFSRKQPPQPRRTLPQRMAGAEENIEQLWATVGELSSGMGGIAGRLDKLEQEPPALPDERDTDTLEFEPFEPFEEVSDE